MTTVVVRIDQRRRIGRPFPWEWFLVCETQRRCWRCGWAFGPPPGSHRGYWRGSCETSYGTMQSRALRIGYFPRALTFILTWRPVRP